VKTLYLRIYLTVVAVLALFALGSGWLVQRHLEQEHREAMRLVEERVAAWAEIVDRSLPAAEAPAQQQASALEEWSQRLRLPMALDDARGLRIAASESFERHLADPRFGAAQAIPLKSGRRLWVLRPDRALFARQRFEFGARADGLVFKGPPEGPLLFKGGSPGGPMTLGAPPDVLMSFKGPPPFMGLQDGPLANRGFVKESAGMALWMVPFLPGGVAPFVVLLLLFVAVSAGAYPVVRRLTRRLEALKQGVEQFGAGALDHRIDASGRDEIAAVATSFNRAAERVQSLVRSHQSLLANASHELRSPLARLKVAVSLLDGRGATQAADEQRARIKGEIHTNIAELDALVEEVLLASRLDAQPQAERRAPVDVLSLLVEESSAVGAEVESEDPAPALVAGDERLLRRALRNLLENARRYGGDEVVATLSAAGPMVEVKVCDRGPGVPEPQRERIFEPFYRLPGHAEREGGVGLGLSLVKQIAQRHRGSVCCVAREGGGSCFVFALPRS
jgi:signal transduction histidine kinase